MSCTKGPWKVGADGWVYAGHETEVMSYLGCGSHEAYFEKEDDKKLIESAPELYEALKNAHKVILMFMPNLPRCFNLDIQLLNETGIEVSSLLAKLKEIE